MKSGDAIGAVAKYSAQVRRRGDGPGFSPRGVRLILGLLGLLGMIDTQVAS
jgi:hypothetical protein